MRRTFAQVLSENPDKIDIKNEYQKLYHKFYNTLIIAESERNQYVKDLNDKIVSVKCFDINKKY